MDIQLLIQESNKLGAQNVQVLAWVPPTSATANPQGWFITEQQWVQTASQTPWYKRS